MPTSTKYFTQACAKCGYVFNRYRTKSRKSSDGLRAQDGGNEVKEHDINAHGDDGEWLETINIHFKIQKK